VVAIVLLIATIVAVAGLSFPKSFGYGLALVAEELTEKPDEYIPLTEPDPYVLQAVSNPGEDVTVGSWNDSEFDEMVSTYKTSNVEIDGKYYRINVYSKDVFFWGVLFLLSIVGWSALGIAVIVWKLIMRARAE
jgi:hypothetical protein